MFKRKNLLLAVAMSALLAACGGGGGDDAPAATAPGTGTNTGTGTGTGTGNDNQQPGAPTADNSLMSGFLRLTADQIVFSGVPITTDQFANMVPGAGPFAKGTNSPLTSFGFRISPVGMETDAGQTKTARIAISMNEQASTGAGQEEQVQVMIDKVAFNTDPAGVFSVADVPDAKVYIYYKPATGTPINVTVDDASGLVSLAPVPGDPTSNYLMFDLETAVTRARAASSGATADTLATLIDIEGTFDAGATLSNVRLMKNDEATELVGPSITVTNAGQAPVVGGGASGRLTVQP